MDTPPAADAAASASVDDATSRAPRTRLVWRVATPLVVLLSGGLFAVSAANSDGTDLRPGRYTDLASLVQNESNSYESLQTRAGTLKSEVDDLTAAVADKKVRRLQRKADKLRAAASVEPASGAGLTVVLSDAPLDKLEAVLAGPDADQYRRFVVHQQDIQAVVNALWAGGSTAVTIQGQRVVTTTGIRCTGSAVQLQGLPYPAPYTIQAVGDPAALISAMQASSGVQGFREDAEDPMYDLGFSVDVEDQVDAPAYTGLLDISYAKPVR
ncbi:DUF881 domain-containing protein [soil metagenome]